MFIDDRFVDYKIKIKNKKLQMAGFIFFMVLAVGAISFGVSGLIKKDSGYYVIEPSIDSEAVNYGKDYELHYYMEGNSSEIKATTREVTGVYSQALLHVYKLLDTDNTYIGYENLASIENKRGEYVNVGNELYSILKDAYEKTCEEQGYNMFAGLLYERWANILVLYDYENFDPLVNAEEQKIISEISKLVNDKNNFKLEFRESDKAVKLTVSDEFEKYCADNEIESKVLDLNLLKESYVMDYVARTLENAGYREGYISTSKGLTITLSELEGCQYPIYGIDNGEIVIKEIVEARPGSVISSFNHFQKKESDILYQKITVNGTEYYRSPFINLDESGFNNLFLSTNTIVYTLNPIEATYLNIKLINAKTREEFENTLDAQIEINQSQETKIEILVY